MQHPAVQVIKSLDSLKTYYETWHDVYDLGRKDAVYADTTLGFQDACDQYDEAFFETGYLVLLLLEECSGSVRHCVDAVTRSDVGELQVSVIRDVPEVGTSDMAQWHIILELDRNALIESASDVTLYLDGALSYANGEVVLPKKEPAFAKPPAAILRTADGDVSLQPAGYSWTVVGTDGKAISTIADQSGRPPSRESVTAVAVEPQCAETVYAPIPGGEGYAPTNSAGYLVKLHWEAEPASVTYICWPETVWTEVGIQEETVISQDGCFYAKPGGWCYEITATWENTGTGYHGIGYYYVFITDVRHTHTAAAVPQTVEEPISGYCGNTWTKVYMDGNTYSFMYGHSVTLTDILVNLHYDPLKVCRCATEFTVDTEFGIGYGINLTEGYARCEKGQADLTVEQITAIREIVSWLKETGGEYPLSGLEETK